MENSFGYIPGKMSFQGSSVNRDPLLEQDQNIDEQEAGAPLAPKKQKVRMKPSKRKKIFGTIKKKKSVLEEYAFICDNAVVSEEKAGSKCTGEVRKRKDFRKRISSRLSRKQKEPYVHLKATSEGACETILPQDTKQTNAKSFIGDKRKYCASNRKKIIEVNTENPGTGTLFIDGIEKMQSVSDTATEVSVLSMTSPVASFDKERERNEVASTRSSSDEKNVLSTLRAESNVVSYFCPGPSLPNQNSLESHDSWRDLQRSSSLSSKHSIGSNGEFSIECKRHVEIVSSISSQSNDYSSSGNSTDGSGSGSISTRELSQKSHDAEEEELRPESFGENMVRRVKSGVKNGVQVVISRCFAPIPNSPPSTKEIDWNLFYRTRS